MERQNGLNVVRWSNFRRRHNTWREEGTCRSAVVGQTARDDFMHRSELSDYLKFGLISVARETVSWDVLGSGLWRTLNVRYEICFWCGSRGTSRDIYNHSEFFLLTLIISFASIPLQKKMESFWTLKELSTKCRREILWKQNISLLMRVTL